MPNLIAHSHVKSAMLNKLKWIDQTKFIAKLNKLKNPQHFSLLSYSELVKDRPFVNSGFAVKSLLKHLTYT